MNTNRRTRWAATVLVLMAAPLLIAQERVRPPAWVEIDPNAIQLRDQPMRIEVGGVPRGERVLLAVLEDCHGGGQPEDTPECPPILERPSTKADRSGTVTDELVLADLETEEVHYSGVGLWLRVTRPGAAQARWARFGYVQDPCSLWSTVVQSFFGGDCDPGLSQALRQHRGPSTLEDTTFEVRLIDPTKAEAVPRPVEGTRGATGVAWDEQITLLVTIAPSLGAEGEEESHPPGLYRFDLEGEARTRLWSPTDTYWATAPYALSGGQIAFARQRLGVHDDGRPTAYLTVLDRSGTVVADHPVHRKIHQIVGQSSEGGSVLALTLGEADNRPAFLRIDLATGEIHTIGYHHALYHAAMRSPSGDQAVIAFENTYGDYGWDLVSVDEEGQLVREVQARQGHDVLPAWNRAGRELAYLAAASPVTVAGHPEAEEDAP